MIASNINNQQTNPTNTTTTDHLNNSSNNSLNSSSSQGDSKIDQTFKISNILNDAVDLVETKKSNITNSDLSLESKSRTQIFLPPLESCSGKGSSSPTPKVKIPPLPTHIFSDVNFRVNLDTPPSSPHTPNQLLNKQQQQQFQLQQQQNLINIQQQHSISPPLKVSPTSSNQSTSTPSNSTSPISSPLSSPNNKQKQLQQQNIENNMMITSHIPNSPPPIPNFQKIQNPSLNRIRKTTYERPPLSPTFSNQPSMIGSPNHLNHQYAHVSSNDQMVYNSGPQTYVSYTSSPKMSPFIHNPQFHDPRIFPSPENGYSPIGIALSPNGAPYKPGPGNITPPSNPHHINGIQYQSSPQMFSRKMQPPPSSPMVPNISNGMNGYVKSPHQTPPQYLNSGGIVQSSQTTSTNNNLIYEGSYSKIENYYFEQIPLLIACYNNNIPSLKKMILSGTDMNYQCKKRGWTPMMLAAQQGHIEILDLLLELKNIDCNIQSSEGNTALFIACSHSRRDIVRNLLSRGANPNIVNKQGVSPLMMASALGDQEIVLLLLQSNSNINITDQKGYTALMYSQIYGYKSPEYDGKKISGEMIEQRRSIIHLLLRYGSKIDTISKDEWSPLKLAIKHGPIDLVEYIIDREENSYLDIDSNNWTPLKIAIRYAPIETIELLLRKGCPVYDNSSQPYSGILLAIQIRNVNVFIKLFENLCQQQYHRNEVVTPQIIKKMMDTCKEFNKRDIEDYLRQLSLFNFS
eukprot:gene8008-9853_t